MTSTPSEPHIPLRGTVAGSSDHWKDPWGPRGQGPGTAGITGNLGQGRLCLGTKKSDLEPRPRFSWATSAHSACPGQHTPVLHTPQNGFCSGVGSCPSSTLTWLSVLTVQNFLSFFCGTPWAGFLPSSPSLLPANHPRMFRLSPRTKKAKGTWRGWQTSMQAHGWPTLGNWIGLVQPGVRQSLTVSFCPSVLVTYPSFPPGG